jgi:hypothetical protein
MGLNFYLAPRKLRDRVSAESDFNEWIHIGRRSAKTFTWNIHPSQVRAILEAETHDIWTEIAEPVTPDEFWTGIDGHEYNLEFSGQGVVFN